MRYILLKQPRAILATVFLAVLSSRLCLADDQQNPLPFTPPKTLPEGLYKYQTLAAAVLALLGASTAVLAVLLSHILTRRRERREQIAHQTELAGNLISLIEAEKQFSDKAYARTPIFDMTIELPNLTAAEICDWIRLEGEDNAVSISEMSQFWRGIYQESKGFPSPITDIVSFVLWAAGRAAILAAGARHRGKGLSSKELIRTAKRIQHLLFAIGIAASDLQSELGEYIQSPRKYNRRPFLLRLGMYQLLHRFLGRPGPYSRRNRYLEQLRVNQVVAGYGPPGEPYRPLLLSEVKEALSRKFLERAESAIRDKRPSESPKDLPEDRGLRVLRLKLPASMIADYNFALSRFKLVQFALEPDGNVEAEGSNVRFFQRLLDCEEKAKHA